MAIARFLYTIGMYLLTPVILYRLAMRGLRYREYFARWQERFGFFAAPGIEGSIWVHAVSVGEVNAALPLIEALMRRLRQPRNRFGQISVSITTAMRGRTRSRKRLTEAGRS